MGRDKSKNSKVRVDILMLEGLHKELDTWCTEHGWSKTKAIEYAVSGFLTQRYQEAKNRGLAEVKH